MKSWKFLIPCVLISTIISFRATGAEFSSFPTSKLFSEVRSGIVHVGLVNETVDEEGNKNLILEKWLGTGFVIDDMCTFATAKHILKGAPEEKLAIRF